MHKIIEKVNNNESDNFFYEYEEKYGSGIVNLGLNLLLNWLENILRHSNSRPFELRIGSEEYNFISDLISDIQELNDLFLLSENRIVIAKGGLTEEKKSQIGRELNRRKMPKLHVLRRPKMK